MPIVYWLLDKSGELTGDCTLNPEKGETYFIGSVLKYGGISRRVNGIVITISASGRDGSVRKKTLTDNQEPDGKEEHENRDRVVKKWEETKEQIGIKEDGE
jgi:hypothetical protein